MRLRLGGLLFSVGNALCRAAIRLAGMTPTTEEDVVAYLLWRKAHGDGQG